MDKITCADCGQPINMTLELCHCCGQLLWSHDRAMDAWTCAGLPGHTHVTPARALTDEQQYALDEHTAAALELLAGWDAINVPDSYVGRHRRGL